MQSIPNDVTDTHLLSQATWRWAARLGRYATSPCDDAQWVAWRPRCRCDRRRPGSSESSSTACSGTPGRARTPAVWCPKRCAERAARTLQIATPWRRWRHKIYSSYVTICIHISLLYWWLINHENVTGEARSVLEIILKSTCDDGSLNHCVKMLTKYESFVVYQLFCWGNQCAKQTCFSVLPVEIIPQQTHQRNARERRTQKKST